MIYRDLKSTDRSDAHGKMQLSSPLPLFLLLIPGVGIVAVLIGWISKKVVTLAKRFSGN